MIEKVEQYKLFVAKNQLLNHVVDFQGFSEGMALIKTLENGYQYINREGIPVIRGGIWHYAENFHEGYSVITSENDGYQFINHQGQVAIATVAGKELNFASRFVDGLALIQNEDDVYQYIDYHGKVVIDGKNWKNASDFYNGKALIENRYGEYQYIDCYGKIIDSVENLHHEPLVPDYFMMDILSGRQYNEGLKLECDATGTLAIIDEKDRVLNYDEILLSVEEFRKLRLQFDCQENEYHEYMYNNCVKLQICYGIQYQNENQQLVTEYFKNEKTRDNKYQNWEKEGQVYRKR